jgi:hypothetical protein
MEWYKIIMALLLGLFLIILLLAFFGEDGRW